MPVRYPSGAGRDFSIGGPGGRYPVCGSCWRVCTAAHRTLNRTRNSPCGPPQPVRTQGALRKGVELPPAHEGTTSPSTANPGQRPRVRHAKCGRTRFASHRDNARALRAPVEMADVDPDGAAGAVADYPAAERVEVERMTTKGPRRFDTRPAVLGIDVCSRSHGRVPGDRHATYAILRMVVRHTTPAVRPDDVLTGLRQLADLAPPSSPTMTRLAQGPLDEATGAIADPFDADRPEAPMTESTGPARDQTNDRRTRAPRPSPPISGPPKRTVPKWGTWAKPQDFAPEAHRCRRR